MAADRPSQAQDGMKPWGDLEGGALVGRQTGEREWPPPEMLRDTVDCTDPLEDRPLSKAGGQKGSIPVDKCSK